MTKKKRQKVLVYLGRELGKYDLECSLDNAIAKLEGWKKEFPDKALVIVSEDDRYDDAWSFQLKEERLENDEEYNKRVAAEALQVEQCRRRDLEQLAILQSRYGSK